MVIYHGIESVKKSPKKQIQDSSTFLSTIVDGV